MIKSHAKINLSLNVLGKINSNFHRIETIVSLRVDKVINKMNLVKRDEFNALKRIVQKSIIDNEKLKKPKKTSAKKKKKTIFRKKKAK